MPFNPLLMLKSLIFLFTKSCSEEDISGCETDNYRSRKVVWKKFFYPVPFWVVVRHLAAVLVLCFLPGPLGWEEQVGEVDVAEFTGTRNWAGGFDRWFARYSNRFLWLRTASVRTEFTSSYYILYNRVIGTWCCSRERNGHSRRGNWYSEIKWHCLFPRSITYWFHTFQFTSSSSNLF